MHGQEIKRVRLKEGFTQEKLAEKCHPFDPTINKSYLSKVENGKSNPTVKKMKAVALAMGYEWKLVKTTEKVYSDFRKAKKELSKQIKNRNNE